MSDEIGQAPAAEVDVLSRIQAALAPERPRAPDGKFAKAAPEPSEEPQDAPVAEEEPEAPTEEEDAPETPAEPEAEEQEIPWEELKDYKIKVPMKRGNEEWEEEVTLSQLREERMMKADYHRNIQQVQAERAQVAKQAQEYAQAVRNQAMQELQAYEAALLHTVEPQFQNVDWNRLATENPAQWAALRQQYDNVSQTLQAVRNRQQQLRTVQEQEQQAQRAESARKAAEEIAKRIPGWNDEMDRGLAKYVLDKGLPPEYVQSGYVPIADASVLEMAWKAQQWDQLQESKPIVTKKVAEAPKVLKPGAKRDPAQDRMTQQAELRKVVSKTGGKGERGEAALAAFLRNRMFGG